MTGKTSFSKWRGRRDFLSSGVDCRYASGGRLIQRYLGRRLAVRAFPVAWLRWGLAQIQANGRRFRRLGGLLPVIRSDIYRLKAFSVCHYTKNQTAITSRRSYWYTDTRTLAVIQFIGLFGGLGVSDLVVIQLHFYGIFSRYFSDTAKDTVDFRLLQLNRIRRNYTVRKRTIG